MNVKTTFLHGDLDKDIYMDKLERFVKKRQASLACILKKSIYRFK